MEKAKVEGLQQPAQAAASEGDGENKDTTTIGGPGGQESFSFSNKRLCERWLDNLFMVLYEVSGRHVLQVRTCANIALGPPSLDDLPRGNSALQNTARGIPQDWTGMGSSRRSWSAASS
jgi:hypothetical protein